MEPSIASSTTFELHGDSEHEDEHSDHSNRASLELQRKASQAIDEGHDADHPSAQGFVLSQEGEERRLRSIAKRLSLAASITRRQSNAEATGNRDVEKGAHDDNAAANNHDTDGITNAGDENTDPNIVWWDGPDDLENPYNWPSWKKIVGCSLISAMTFITPLASSIFAPAVPQVLAEFHSSSLEIASFVVSVYVLGFAAGPLLIAPLSEIYGRVPVYHVCNLGFILFAVACALAPSLGSLIAFRFFCGVFGSAPLTNGGGSIADMIVQEKRGTVLSLFSVGPLIGPIAGPIAGGFLSDAMGWRWTFWLLAIVGAFFFLLMIAFLKETYAPVIIQRKAARLRKETGNPLLRSKLDVGLSPSDYFKHGIVRPFKMFFQSPLIIIMALYTAAAYGYLYLLFTTVSEVFISQYGFSPSLVGLAFLGLGIGSLLGLFLFSWFSDTYMKLKAERVARTTGGKAVMKPEYRLPALPIGSVFIPAGLFIYGWTAQAKVHWVVPIIGTGIIGVGNLLVFLSIQIYLVDAYTLFAASALASNTVIRSLAGAFLPLAGGPLFERLGYGLGNTVLGVIAVVLLPVSFGIMKYGETLRMRYPIKNL